MAATSSAVSWIIISISYAKLQARGRWLGPALSGMVGKRERNFLIFRKSQGSLRQAGGSWRHEGHACPDGVGVEGCLGEKNDASG